MLFRALDDIASPIASDKGAGVGSTTKYVRVWVSFMKFVQVWV